LSFAGVSVKAVVVIASRPLDSGGVQTAVKAVVVMASSPLDSGGVQTAVKS